MSAPLYDSLLEFAASNPLRMHMPGHKGVSGGAFSQIAAIDFTEIAPTGNLYTCAGPIREAETRAAAFAGAGDALFFTCGSTQGIYTMLAEAVGMGGGLILQRGCHKSVYHAMALLDITPYYIYESMLPGTSIPAPISPEAVRSAIAAHPECKAVFLTAPNYYGVMTNLAPIAELCHKSSMFLLVDQAHGAHFPALGLPSATEEGADLAVVSTHKTWPAMGSSSILYKGMDAPFSLFGLKRTAQLFGTTSPSYPIMASIDYARDQLQGTAGAQYRACAGMVSALREKINEETPFHALTEQDGAALDPCRLTIDTLCAGLLGETADALLQQQNIYVEMSDERYLVLILTCHDAPEDFRRLFDAIRSLMDYTGTAAAALPLPPAPQPIVRVSIRQAVFGGKLEVPLRDAAGMISADFIAPYPPGIPVIAPGEEITEKHIAYLQKKRYNIDNHVYVASDGAPIGRANQE